MKKRQTVLAGLLIAVVLPLAGNSILAQGKAGADKKDAQQNVQGTVQSINKAASTITVKVATSTRVVSHNASTKFMSGHTNDAKIGALSQVKESYYISCAGTFDSKGVLMARECIYRESR